MPAKKPNILFLLADDYGAWAMGCSGNREVKTPTLDRLAENGMRFENFFCASPVCSPVRASIFTGKIPSQHGVHDWLDKGHLDAELLSDELKESFDDPNRPWYCDWIKFSLEGDKAVPYLAPPQNLYRGSFGKRLRVRPIRQVAHGRQCPPPGRL